LASPVFLTYRYRVKDATAGKRLDRMAVSVNQVWNYCGGIQNDSRRLNRRWPSAFDLIGLTNGCTKELGLHSDTVQAVCKQFASSRDKAKRKPRWRVSKGSRRSLGWVPFQCDRPLKVNGDTVTFLGHKYRLWLSRPIPDNIKCGSFSQDATGRWYLNLVCEVADDLAHGTGEIGIDLGLKDFAALSNGEKIENPRHLRKSASKLARAQRAGRKAQARKINRKIAAQRRHFLHEKSTEIARANALIVVGDVNSAALARTRMAKSVLDAGWSAFRSMLRYKAIRHGARFVEENERYSTQTCSCCGAIGGPKGLKDLRVRSWDCEDCGVLHDRDTNAALNILRSGRNAALQTTEIPAPLGRGRR
jgi:transposase